MKKQVITFLVALTAIIYACNTGTTENNTNDADSLAIDSVEHERNIEAREDSIELANALARQSKYANRIVADYETEAVQSLEGEDAADDPAIWVNSNNPEKSLIIGTNKKAGLYVYDLHGNEIQFIKAGFINNADVRYGFELGGEKIDIVAGSNRTDNTVVVFKIDKQNQRIVNEPICTIQSNTDEVYGICLYNNHQTNQHFVFVNGKGGQIEQWLLSNSNDTMTAKIVRTFSVNSQPEGMVADDLSALLYVGVEEEGIFKYKAMPGKDTLAIKIAESDTSNPHISYDIEGLTIYRVSETEGYLLASSQGSFSYAIFDLSDNNNYINSFVIKDGTVDAVEETDGIDVTSIPLGSEFPKGIFVAQDGFNKDNGVDVNQNFKIVSCEKILDLLK